MQDIDIGTDFSPYEPYTHRLRKILEEEYPDGSQVIREILQNSDDAGSTEQTFILDHNTYPSNSLFKATFKNYQRPNLKLDRHQGPALLAKNTTTFGDRDFQSLLKLADSEKRDQYDKIGVMGVGFNSIYHITDSPSFITGDKYIILDPHKWCFNGGIKFEFIANKLSDKYPDQFAPFNIPCDKPFDGTIFRYPLRTKEDSADSEISDKIYQPEEILDMFHKFYEHESINCLLFLKYIERISFYELKKGASELELLYTIQLENADKIRKQRCLIAEKIGPMMDELRLGKLKSKNQLVASYVASFCRQKKTDPKKHSSWLILNYLDDLLETEGYFQENFKKNIRDHKFIPNVGLAIPFNDLKDEGKLFCFLPLPIPMPFPVSVHGYFAVNTSRRSLWSVAENEDLAVGALASTKVSWNQYLFEKVLPKAWVKFLCEIFLNVPNIQSEDISKFWPIIKRGTSSVTYTFCKDLLQNVIENLGVDDHVFKGPPSIGTLPEVLANSYDASSFKGSQFYWLSISNGYLEDEKSYNSLTEIIRNIGFPVMSASPLIIEALKNSKHKYSLKFFSPTIIRNYLKHNRDRWQDKLSRSDVLLLFEYVLKDKNFEDLEGFKMIPLADGTFGTLQFDDSCVYIVPNRDHEDDELNLFENQLNKFIDKSIGYELYMSLYRYAEAGWKLNIKVLDENVVANMIKTSLNFAENANSEEIPMSNHREWIYKLWNNLRNRNWDLRRFENVHLIPTSRSFLRKLCTPKKIFSARTTLTFNFEKFGTVFIEDEFEEIAEWNKLSPYIMKPNNIISVLNSLKVDNSFPENVNHTLHVDDVSALVEYLSNNLRFVNKKDLVQNLVKVIKHLPIFTKVDHTSPVPLSPGNTNWYLLPRNEENSYGKIICPSNKGEFLSTSSQNLRYILEDIIKIPRLTSQIYWQKYVIPYLGSQPREVLDTVIDILFDMLPSLHDDANLKVALIKTSFVPVGTRQMSQHQQLPAIIELEKPTGLFDPEVKAVACLFFEDERVFPAGKYSSSKKFLTGLRLLGLKTSLSSNDVINRIDAIVERKKSNVQDDLIYYNALRLFEYIDNNWDQLNNSLLNTILKQEWIPTVDKSGKKFFSKPQDCYCQKDKDLVCLFAPILEYEVKNNKFLKDLKWNTYPDFEKVIKQYELCYDGVSKMQPPKNLEKICYAIYKYMNEICPANNKNSKEDFNKMKTFLENKPWILYRKTFYSVDQVVFRLQKEFQVENFLIVELPIGYTSEFMTLFKTMGVREE
ncbi:3777_t:CDS:2, partial [Funneliformis mosseae]